MILKIVVAIDVFMLLFVLAMIIMSAGNALVPIKESSSIRLNKKLIIDNKNLRKKLRGRL